MPLSGVTSSHLKQLLHDFSSARALETLMTDNHLMASHAGQAGLWLPWLAWVMEEPKYQWKNQNINGKTKKTKEIKRL